MGYKMKKHILVFLFVSFFLPLIAEENGSVFEFDSKNESESSSSFQCTIGGEVSIGGGLFFDELRNTAKITPGLPIAAKLHLYTAAPFTEAYFGVNIDDRTLGMEQKLSENCFPSRVQIPSWIDEMYLKLLFDSVVFSTGIQKVTWGRAEFLSVLDKLNPLDKTRLPSWNRQTMKMPRPLFSTVVYWGSIKCEWVFLPVFEGHRIRLNGYLQDGTVRNAALQYANGEAIFLEPVSTDTLKYAQGGGRCSFTLFDTHDVGVQYFYGRLHDVGIIKHEDRFIPQYDPYHHIGIDYGTVVGPVSLWAEAGLTITHDTKGTNASVHNSFVEWNSGFSYNALYGLSLNITAAQHIILHHKHIYSFSDVEYGRSVTTTTIFAGLSQSLLRGAFEWRLGGYMDIEDTAFCVMPGIQWFFASFTVDCTAGIFGGKQTKKSPHPFDNSFVKLTVSYAF